MCFWHLINYWLAYIITKTLVQSMQLTLNAIRVSTDQQVRIFRWRCDCWRAQTERWQLWHRHLLSVPHLLPRRRQQSGGDQKSNVLYFCIASSLSPIARTGSINYNSSCNNCNNSNCNSFTLQQMITLKRKNQTFLIWFQAYTSGELTTGELKKELITLLQQIVGDHQEKRKRVTNETVRQYMEPRKLNFCY